MELDRIVTSSGRISSTYLLIHAGSAGGSSGNLGVQEPMQGLMKEQVLILKKRKIWGCTPWTLTSAGSGGCSATGLGLFLSTG